MEICKLPGCDKPVKTRTTHFCCISHGAKYGGLVRYHKYPKLPVIIDRVKPENFIAQGSLPYKDRLPEVKGKWVAYVTARQKRIKQATPKWADRDAILATYVKAQTLTKETGIPHEVDHIIPVKGKLVSGLHVPNNLQILTENTNQSKSNKFSIIN